MGGACSSMLDLPDAPVESRPEQQPAAASNPADDNNSNAQPDDGGSSGYESDGENVMEARRVKIIPQEEQKGVEVGAVRPWIGITIHDADVYCCFTKERVIILSKQCELHFVSIVLSLCLIVDAKIAFALVHFFFLTQQVQ
jgi:hypothetical protein